MVLLNIAGSTFCLLSSLACRSARLTESRCKAESGDALSEKRTENILAARPEPYEKSTALLPDKSAALCLHQTYKHICEYPATT